MHGTSVLGRAPSPACALRWLRVGSELRGISAAVHETRLQYQILPLVVHLLGQGRVQRVEAAVSAGLDALVGLLVAVPLASGQLELASAAISLLPRAVRPTVSPFACGWSAQVHAGVRSHRKILLFTRSWPAPPTAVTPGKRRAK